MGGWLGFLSSGLDPIDFASWQGCAWGGGGGEVGLPDGGACAPGACGVKDSGREILSGLKFLVDRSRRSCSNSG